MAGLNCHFVSRFLTTPWEHGQRQLWHYDFTTDEVRSSSSRSLFAVGDANTLKVEARLNQVIETPISTAMARLVQSSDELIEWPVFRAVSLLLMLQPLRSSTRPEHAERLEETVLRTDAELDEVARAAQASYQIGRVTVRCDAPLLYPAAGFFPLVGKKDDGTWGMAIALPVSGRHVFIAVPRTMDWTSATAIWSAQGAGFVANMSVGTSRLVVIPPFAMDDPQRAGAKIRQLRNSADELTALCREHNEALDRLNAAMGMA